MLILSTVKMELRILGIFPISEDDLPLVLQPHRLTINFLHITFMIVSLVTYQLAILHFLLFEANTFSEYADSGLYATAALLDIAVYAILISKRWELLEALTNLERIILKSKESIDFILSSLVLV